MAGYWEFPGGKRRAAESGIEALARELGEELGIEIERAVPLMTLRHDYPDRQVELEVWKVEAYRGEPRALEGQPLAWVEPGELTALPILPADAAIVARVVADTPRPGAG
jgi:8-oxo-dGTP diphosphatase